ncbi:type II toxin-antitoxin system RatA family toxin [Rickettsia rhipicephali]|uniref:Oligoketide cyclase/lipid transport protein n=1 Tax=Rickettsia rhipicephali (strain 3-7-female6-CWPP) TaxID=1105113 RepID=A0AAI8A972_RICR3|nr:type II toxin-antitoxin system RatA family toxin [Rickettsia rhipicephali]AFC71992.1 oligoketide cyclase/lipid transport protein [Rickettsia rhipicephali str. 3-7-female6-CWPP]MCX4080440.1 type II toxin-antitoxin system RatA family toxin [Rickettsia rhipicephali]
MPCLQHTKILPYKPQELFDLVWDVKSYPKFLPWCSASRIISENNQEVIAELVIQLKGFSEKYNSRVTSEITDDGIYLINTVAISGPFEYLKSTWQFIPYTAGTELKFFIDFKMKSVILDKLIGTYFTKATEKMIIAFERRAKEVIK